MPQALRTVRNPVRSSPSLGKTSTDEIAVMIDTFKPLQLAQAALECEDPQYFRSWIEEPAKT